MAANSPQMLANGDCDVTKYDAKSLNSFRSEDVVVNPSDPRLAISPEQMKIHQHRNQIQSQKNPQLSSVLDDPAKFFKGLEERFEAQKLITPDDPYQFEFGDYGVPVLKDISATLDEEVEILKKKLAATSLADSGEKSGLMAALAAIGSFINPFSNEGRGKDLKVGLEYLDTLKKDIDSHVESGKISYRRLNELGNFSARVLGHFDREDLSLFDRTFLRLDRSFLGYEQGSIQEEFQRYKNNDTHMFDKASSSDGVRVARPAFEEGRYDTEKFQMATLPVAKDLGPGVFMQLIPHDIFLLGISGDPAPADGFNRPGGDFYNHDLRHSSSIYTKRRLYEKEHNLSPEQIHKLETLQSVWKQEMIEAKKKIESKEKRYAIGFLSFNHHHDRGIPQLPSSFIEEEKDIVSEGLYLALRMSGQPRGFDSPRESLNEAYDWLRNFWLERLPQEEAVLAASTPAA